MATISTESIMTVPKKKRAPRCSELGNPEIRSQIEFRYGTLGWRLDTVVEDINRAYNLSATKYQYRDRLHKWGCKQRLNNRQYQHLYHDILARQALGKKSKIVLNNTTNIEERKIERWVKRNITFSQRYFPRETSPITREIQIATAILVRSPSPNHVGFLLPIVKKSANETSLNLPFMKLQSCIKDLFPNCSKCISSSNSRNTQDFQILETIIYKISNGIYSCHPWSEIEKLLNEVDEKGLRSQFKLLLSVKSAHLLEKLSPLIIFFYLRKDDDMLRSMQVKRSQLRQTFYAALQYCMDYGPETGFPQRIRGRVEAEILTDLSSCSKYENLAPESVEDAYCLLQSCKDSKEHFLLFFKLWDSTKISVKDLESFVESFKYRSVRMAPLYSEDASQLQKLLSYGFSQNMCTMLLESIVYDKHDVARILSRRLQIPTKYSNLISWNEITTEKHTWELFEPPILYEIISNSASELRALSNARETWDEQLDAEVYLLSYLACIEPNMIELSIDILRWKYSVSQETAALMAIDTIPSSTSVLSAGFNCIQFQRRLALETLLRKYKVDPNTTKFWKITIWDELAWGIDRENAHFGSTGRELLGVLLHFGADLDGIWCRNLDDNQDYRWPLGQKLKYYDLERRECPLEIAFKYQESGVFCYLLQKAVTTNRLLELLASESYSAVNPRFVQALRDRDIGAVHEKWDQRIGFDPELDSLKLAVSEGDRDTVRRLIINMNNLKRIRSAFGYIAVPPEEEKRLDDPRYEMLEMVLEMGADISLEPSFWSVHGDTYRFSLHDAIYHDDPRALALLLRFDSANIAFEQNLNSPKYHHLQERGIYLLGSAIKWSMRCFKYLLNQGFHIDQFEGNADKGDFIETALSEAIVLGDLSILAFVLSEGANVYAPCGNASSAIEFAISMWRIDSAALILNTVPACYPLALTAVGNSAHGNDFIIEYVHKWKEDRECSSIRGSIIAPEAIEDLEKTDPIFDIEKDSVTRILRKEKLEIEEMTIDVKRDGVAWEELIDFQNNL